MNRAPVVDVQTFINEQPFGGFQWLVFLMCFVIVLLDGFDTAAIGFIAPSLLGEWNLTKPDLAPVLSAALFSTFSLVISCLVKNRERFMGIGQVMTMPLFFASNAIYPI